MGRVYADIELIATDDLAFVSQGYLEPAKIRRMNVNFLVDSGADYLAINENIKNQLKLRVLFTQTFEMADGSVVPCDIVGPVDLRFSNRECTCRAIVLPGQAVPLLGSIPMEDMDLVIHPKNQTLSVNPENPLIARHYLKGYRKLS